MRSHKPPRFLHHWMFESAGIRIKCGGFEAELAAGLVPVGDGGEDFAQDGFGGGSFEAEA